MLRIVSTGLSAKDWARFCGHEQLVPLLTSLEQSEDEIEAQLHRLQAQLESRRANKLPPPAPSASTPPPPTPPVHGEAASEAHAEMSSGAPKSEAVMQAEALVLQVLQADAAPPLALSPPLAHAPGRDSECVTGSSQGNSGGSVSESGERLAVEAVAAGKELAVAGAKELAVDALPATCSVALADEGVEVEGEGVHQASADADLSSKGLLSGRGERGDRGKGRANKGGKGAGGGGARSERGGLGAQI